MTIFVREPGESSLPRRRALVAAAPKAHARVARALSGFDVEFVRDLSSATAALERGTFDVIVVGVYVLESRAIEVLRRLRVLAPSTAVICVRAAEPRYAMRGATLRAFRLASEQLGACGLVDFLAYPDNRSGNASIQAAIERLISRCPEGARAKPSPRSESA